MDIDTIAPWDQDTAVTLPDGSVVSADEADAYYDAAYESALLERAAGAR